MHFYLIIQKILSELKYKETKRFIRGLIPWGTCAKQSSLSSVSIYSTSIIQMCVCLCCSCGVGFIGYFFWISGKGSLTFLWESRDFFTLLCCCLTLNNWMLCLGSCEYNANISQTFLFNKHQLCFAVNYFLCPVTNCTLTHISWVYFSSEVS